MKSFGYWPSFHDAQVVDFRYATEGSGFISLTLHTWEMTAEVEERGYFRRIKHHLVQFAFREISDAHLENFTAAGNILFGVWFSTPGECKACGEFWVDLDSAMGSDRGGSFHARVGEIVGVAPCDGQGR